MRNVEVGRTITAPRSSVWALLADYPNIDDWNDGVLNSYSIGDATEGVGAQRQTELAPKGAMRMRETVTEWAPEKRMTIAIDKIEKQPIKRATMTFTLSDDRESTAITMSYDYEPKGGPLALLYGPILDRVMKKGFGGFIDILESATQARNIA